MRGTTVNGDGTPMRGKTDGDPLLEDMRRYADWLYHHPPPRIVLLHIVRELRWAVDVRHLWEGRTQDVSGLY